MSAHSVPLYCCYCGGEDLFPHAGDDAAQHGVWECRECLRVFRASFVGLLARPGGGIR